MSLQTFEDMLDYYACKEEYDQWLNETYPEGSQFVVHCYDENDSTEVALKDDDTWKSLRINLYRVVNKDGSLMELQDYCKKHKISYDKLVFNMSFHNYSPAEILKTKVVELVI